MSYAKLQRRLDAGEIIILDGGTGTELERRGVPMDDAAWCGPANLHHGDALAAVHGDFIAAGADLITANTYASSRLMLGPAGFGGEVEAINLAAVAAALAARQAADRPDIVIAGSLSHMYPRVDGTEARASGLGASEIAAAHDELAGLHRDAGCDMVLLEMMYHPDRMTAAFEAAKASGLPFWAGFSARRGADGEVLSYADDRDIPFAEVVQILADYDVPVAGIMHSAADVTGDALAILRQHFSGPMMAYPESGFFEMPHWQFHDIMTPAELLGFAGEWTAAGVQAVGGCCGLSPIHIAALGDLKSSTGS